VSVAAVLVAAVLVAYAACLGMVGSRMLGRARWTARAPLLAIVVYLTAGWSVVAAVGLAGLTLAVHATALGGELSQLIGACVHRLRATYGTPGGITVAGLGLTMAGAVVARTALTATTHLRAAGRQALGWWLVGTSRTMLALARQHALDRVQFGRPVASFQAIRHRLAETLVAVEGAEATLVAATAEPDDFGFLLGKAAAGQAASIAARHCQQVLGGIGFTEEHELHRHVKRSLVLDGMLGSSRELTREAGATLRAKRFAPRLAQL